MKPAMKIAGNFRATEPTISPILAVSVYPGATVEIPRMAPERTPILLAANPLLDVSGAGADPETAGSCGVAIGPP